MFINSTDLTGQLIMHVLNIILFILFIALLFEPRSNIMKYQYQPWFAPNGKVPIGVACGDTGMPLTVLTHHKAKFEWTPTQHTAFMMLKEGIIQAPISCYPDPARKYIVYMDASDNMCGAQLSQEYNGSKFQIAFLSNMFTETERKWSTPDVIWLASHCSTN